VDPVPDASGLADPGALVDDRGGVDGDGHFFCHGRTRNDTEIFGHLMSTNDSVLEGLLRKARISWSPQDSCRCNILILNSF
jgi:hypothetical protein